jgi:8-oxo-dGTP pyrophosphatase MutT (NUDIX family)
MTDAAFRATTHLFAEAQRDPKLLEAFGAEYERVEALLCVDRTGEPVAVNATTLADLRRAVQKAPELGRWFREATLPDGRRAVLISRWLCHAAGFRHRTVHLLLDHPTLLDHTVLQVRGLNRPEAPGLFDLPAAGHVAGLETVEDALRKELREELNVSLNAVEDLTCLGSYTYADLDGVNVEYRTVFRGRLSEVDWMRLGASDEELLAIVFLPVHKLAALITAHPERVASGLSGSLGRYLLARNGERSASDPAPLGADGLD